MMKTIALALALSSAAAFSPTLNGWVPDSKAFCYGLPGALAPVGNFDPAGFAVRHRLGVHSQSSAPAEAGRSSALERSAELATEAPPHVPPSEPVEAKAPSSAKADSKLASERCS